MFEVNEEPVSSASSSISSMTTSVLQGLDEILHRFHLVVEVVELRAMVFERGPYHNLGKRETCHGTRARRYNRQRRFRTAAPLPENLESVKSVLVS